MNKVELIGRLCGDPETRQVGEKDLTVSRYRLAVPRRNGRDEADFINCVAFGRAGEFADKYLRKGMRMAVVGHIQTGSYKDKDGRTVYTTDVVVDEHYFCESKSTTQQADMPEGFESSDGIQGDLPFM